MPNNQWMPHSQQRRHELDLLFAQLDLYLSDLKSLATTPRLTREEVLARLDAFNFSQAKDLQAGISDTIALLRDGIVHVPHPRYFGLYNPAPNFPSIIGDIITAVLNPQLAAYTHAPAATEIEQHVLTFIAGLMGWERSTLAAHFTTGGAEANYTAALCALTAATPHFATEGARAFKGPVAIYVSAESHLAWIKIAHQCGIGRQAVRLVPTDGQGAMALPALEKIIAEDRRHGVIPVMIAATAGTTNAGMCDPLIPLAQMARREKLYYHIDAAWAGAALLSEKLRSHLKGIELGDSVTIDAHKWFSVPMGAGMFFSQNQQLLTQTFGIETSYMPANIGVPDPYTQSTHWSRRLIGLKFFLAMAVIGKEGYASVIERQVMLAERLRDVLSQSEWRIHNASPFAVVCFSDPAIEVKTFAQRVQDDGAVWISPTRYEGQAVLRACITSFHTSEADIDATVEILNRYRDVLRSSKLG